MRDGLARTAALTSPTRYVSLWGGYSSVERFTATAEVGFRPLPPVSLYGFARWGQLTGLSSGGGVRYDF